MKATETEISQLSSSVIFDFGLERRELWGAAEGPARGGQDNSFIALFYGKKQHCPVPGECPVT